MTDVAKLLAERIDARTRLAMLEQNLGCHMHGRLLCYFSDEGRIVCPHSPLTPAEASFMVEWIIARIPPDARALAVARQDRAADDLTQER
jgi:hypothetical protein